MVQHPAETWDLGSSRILDITHPSTEVIHWNLSLKG